MRRMTAAAVLLALAGCTSADRGATESSTTEWIEVPLAENVYREIPEGYRQDVLEVYVPPGPGLEVKLAMKEGAALVYMWDVEDLDDPGLLLSEFHGHTERAPGEAGTVMFYRKATGGSESGSLVAPFDGIHGWYFRNDSNAPILVRITVAGFYEIAST